MALSDQEMQIAKFQQKYCGGSNVFKINMSQEQRLEFMKYPTFYPSESQKPELANPSPVIDFEYLSLLEEKKALRLADRAKKAKIVADKPGTISVTILLISMLFTIIAGAAVGYMIRSSPTTSNSHRYTVQINDTGVLLLLISSLTFIITLLSLLSARNREQKNITVGDIICGLLFIASCIVLASFLGAMFHL